MTADRPHSGAVIMHGAPVADAVLAQVAEDVAKLAATLLAHTLARLAWL